MSKNGVYLKEAKAKRPLTCVVEPVTMNWIKSLSEDCGMSRGEVIDNIVKWYVEGCRKE